MVQLLDGDDATNTGEDIEVQCVRGGNACEEDGIAGPHGDGQADGIEGAEDDGHADGIVSRA